MRITHPESKEMELIRHFQTALAARFNEMKNDTFAPQEEMPPLSLTEFIENEAVSFPPVSRSREGEHCIADSHSYTTP